MTIIHLSNIHLSVNLDKFPVPCEHYGESRDYKFWNVQIDDIDISSICQPFNATDPIIEMYGSPVNNVWGDGDGMISVRSIGDYVIWAKPVDSLGLPPHLMWSAVDSNTFYLFDKYSYITEVEKSFNREQKISSYNFFNREAIDIYSKIILGQIVRTNYPPDLTGYELRQYLSPLLSPKNVSFRLPVSGADCTGAVLSEAIKQWLSNIYTIQVSPPPSEYLEFKILYNFPTNGPTVVKIGYTGNHLCIFFESNPRFPLWLYAPEYNHILRTIPEFSSRKESE